MAHPGSCSGIVVNRSEMMLQQSPLCSHALLHTNRTLTKSYPILKIEAQFGMNFELDICKTQLSCLLRIARLDNLLSGLSAKNRAAGQLTFWPACLKSCGWSTYFLILFDWNSVNVGFPACLKWRGWTIEAYILYLNVSEVILNSAHTSFANPAISKKIHVKAYPTPPKPKPPLKSCGCLPA